MNEQHSFCHFCGTKYSTLSWPRTCDSITCNRQVWRRIDQVAVILQPVLTTNGNHDIIIGRRGIAPHIGEYALPGGHVEFGEEIEQAAIRELFEETGISVENKLRYVANRVTPHGVSLYFFVNKPILYQTMIEQWTPSEECPEIKLVGNADEI